MKKTNIKAIRSRETIVLSLNSDTINIQKKSNPELFDLVDKLMSQDNLAEIERQFTNIKQRIESFTKGIFTVEDERVVLKGDNVEIPKAILKKLVELEQSKEDFLPLMRFWRKLKENPSKNSREQLYSYMIANRMSITEQGDIVFEKGVNKKAGASAPDQLVDGHTGRVDHSIGMVVEMPRDKVNDNPKQTCSHGLHCAPPEYVREFYGNNVIIEVVVNPRDVVSVPIDYGQKKVRVCRMQVMGYASKTPRSSQVVKLSDFLQDMPEEYKNTVEKHEGSSITKGTKSTKSTHTSTINTSGNLVIEITDAEEEIKGKTASEIIIYVEEKTGEKITIQLKNKSGIIKKAIEILDKYNSQNVKLMNQEVNEFKSNEEIVAVESMTAREIIAFIEEKYNVDLSHISLKNKNKILKEACQVIEAHAVVRMIDVKKDIQENFETDTKSEVSESNTIPTDLHEDIPVESKKQIIELSLYSKEELIKKCKIAFNEKIGGLLISDKKVRERATLLFKNAGYEVR